MANDLRWAIGKVMEEAHASKLANMGMWDFDKGNDKGNDKGKFKPLSSHNLSFDSQQNQLEPIYYWVLDFMEQVDRGGAVKLIDNFMASPGSGQFSEMNQKASIMQDKAVKMSGDMNQLIKSILNLVYDLKEFELRLESYDDFNSEDKEKKAVGILALKQVWLDNVDMKKGRGAIHQMATAEMGFSTLREAFMMANSVKDVDKMNSDDKKEGGGGLINDSVMRILKPRINEFLKWAKYSEAELRKRFSIEKNYLKSQIETVKLYSQWMKPYLESAEKLRQQGFEKDAALVNAFSTTMFELQLFHKKEVRADDERFKGYKPRRKYYEIIMVTFKYRGHVSQRVTQKGDYGFGMGGVVDMWFDSYALNEEELDAANVLLDKNDLDRSMDFSLDIAGEALADLKEDLDYFLKNREDREKEELEKKMGEKGGSDLDINPFAALFGLFKKGTVKKKDKNEPISPGDIKKDNFVEKTMRGAAMDGAAGILYTIYDVYKKAHRMASAPNIGFDNYDTDASEDLKDGGDVGFTDIFRGRGD